jgi:hypothetical protein
MLMPILIVVLLLAGLIVRRLPERVGARDRPFWKAQGAFASRRDFTLYVLGTVSIASGALLLALSAVLDLW